MPEVSSFHSNVEINMVETGNNRVAIFDGTCGLCTAFVRWAQVRIRTSVIQWVAYQEVDRVSLPVQVTPAQAAQAFVWIDREGKTYRGARAIFQMLCYLRWPWRLAGLLLANPVMAALAEPVYRLVARYRHHISRRLSLPACEYSPVADSSPAGPDVSRKNSSTTL